MALLERLLLAERLERRDLVPAREGQEAFLRRGAMGQVGLEHALDGFRRILRLDVVKDLAAAHGVGSKAAADMNVIALDLIAVLGNLHLHAEQSDVADVMLRAGIRTAGEVDVDRAVELARAIRTMLRDVLGMALVLDMARRQPALPVHAISPARIEVALVGKPDRLDGGFGGWRRDRRERLRSTGSARP